MGFYPLPDHPPGEKPALFSGNQRLHGLVGRHLQKIVFLEGACIPPPHSGAREKTFFDFFFGSDLWGTHFGTPFGPILDPFWTLWTHFGPFWSLWVTIEAINRSQWLLSASNESENAKKVPKMGLKWPKMAKMAPNGSKMGE